MPDFMVIPAIDLRNGKCVRLRRGKLSEETVYADDPVKMALAWEKEGPAGAYRAYHQNSLGRQNPG